MTQDLEHLLSQLSQPDNAVIQQVISQIPRLLAKTALSESRVMSYRIELANSVAVKTTGLVDLMMALLSSTLKSCEVILVEYTIL